MNILTDELALQGILPAGDQVVQQEQWSTPQDSSSLLPDSGNIQLSDAAWVEEDNPQLWPGFDQSSLNINNEFGAQIQQGADSYISETSSQPTTLNLEPANDSITGNSLGWDWSTNPTEAIFVDSKLNGYSQLANTIEADLASSGRTGRIVIINESQSAYEQIDLALSGMSQLAAIHIFSHGEAGAIRLNGELLSEQELSSESNLISSWGQALRSDGDILLYGCGIGAGSIGSSYLQTLAAITGADIAASVDATGDTNLGGDWLLESQVGAIETVALSPYYQGLLAAPWSSM
jgi:hypothetical protein